ncbi:hypothetical protein [Vibrio phage RYC]|nr:hypothetical protein [Vibrio phage RYC]
MNQKEREKLAWLLGDLRGNYTTSAEVLDVLDSIEAIFPDVKKGFMYDSSLYVSMVEQVSTAICWHLIRRMDDTIGIKTRRIPWMQAILDSFEDRSETFYEILERFLKTTQDFDLKELHEGVRSIANKGGQSLPYYDEIFKHPAWEESVTQVLESENITHEDTREFLLGKIYEFQYKDNEGNLL